MQEYNDMVFQSKNGAYAKMQQFAFMTDEIHNGVPALLPSGKGRVVTIFNPGSKSVSQTYENLVDSCEVADSEIDPKIEEKLTKMRDKLFKEKVLKNPEFDKEEIESESNPKEITQTFISPMYKNIWNTPQNMMLCWKKTMQFMKLLKTMPVKWPSHTEKRQI